MANTTPAQQFDYFVFKGEESAFKEYLCDSFDCNEDAQNYLEEEGFESMEGFVVPQNHYFKGFFLYNDVNDYDEIDEYMEMCCISFEHIELYQDSNDGGGHHQWIKTEEWRDGTIVSTTIHSDADGNYFDNYPAAVKNKK